MRDSVAHLVIRAPNWLGDAVMALPALDAVRRAYAESKIVLAARATVAPLFEEDTPARPDEILVVDDAHERWQLREARADAILLLPNSFASAWRASRAGIPERWGYRAGSRSLATLSQLLVSPSSLRRQGPRSGSAGRQVEATL